jgi:hypothetical protein
MRFADRAELIEAVFPGEGGDGCVDPVETFQEGVMANHDDAIQGHVDVCGSALARVVRTGGTCFETVCADAESFFKGNVRVLREVLHVSPKSVDVHIRHYPRCPTHIGLSPGLTSEKLIVHE